jgi:two-component system sensor histidine kinase/response regulator
MPSYSARGGSKSGWPRGRIAPWSIRDSGIGISPASQQRLFEKFFRAENAHTVDTEGTGLGLYLVRLIVERLGGAVACESEEGRGTLFYFRLPLAAGEVT